MKNRFLLAAFIVFAFTLLSPHQSPWAADLTLDKAPVQVYFSPKGGCTDAIVEQIGRVKSEPIQTDGIREALQGGKTRHSLPGGDGPMSAAPVKNIAASIKNRLLAAARQSGKRAQDDFQELIFMVDF